MHMWIICDEISYVQYSFSLANVKYVTIARLLRQRYWTMIIIIHKSKIDKYVYSKINNYSLYQALEIYL